MQNVSSRTILTKLRSTALVIVVAFASLSLLSFSVKTITVDFLTQLGITRQEANSKISGSLLGGYFNAYGIKNAKNIALGNRSAVAKEILNYVKEYTSSEGFKKSYLEMKDSKKPQPSKFETPKEMRRNTIEMYKKSLSEMEASAKKADASLKAMFDGMITEGRKQLKDAEDPNNKMFANYAKGYPAMLKQSEEGYQQQLATWEKKYPSNQLLFVKERLLTFLKETNDINFDAELTTNKYGKKIFTDPAYERKGNYWKMAFRAGKEVVEPSRAFVQQWLTEIK